MTDDIDDPFLTIDEAAQLLRVSRRTLDNYRYRKRVHRTGAMAAASSTGSAISWHGRSSAGPATRSATRTTRHRLCTLALLGIGSLAILFPKADAPVLLWNASPSVPIGLYRLTSRPPLTAALAVIRLPEPLRILAETRGYLRKGALLIKPVAAGAGDTVCRHGALVTVNGRIVARARTLDAAGRLAAGVVRLLPAGGRPHLRALSRPRQLRQPLHGSDRPRPRHGDCAARLGAPSRAD